MKADASAARSRPRHRRRAALAAAACLGAGLACAQITAPAYTWQLPVFTGEGYRTMLARGSEARATDDRRFEVTDLTLTLFSGDKQARVENVIISPAATFSPDARTAQGEKSVRFVGEGIEATGTRWIYHHAEKKISLDGAVRVTFEAELKDLLK